MKIGILLSRVPYPLEKGDKLRAFHQIKELSKKHELYVCALNVGKLHPKAIEKISPYCKELKIVQLNKIFIFYRLIINLLFTKLPMQLAYFYQKSSKTDIQNFFLHYQVEHLYCQLIRVSEYVKDLKSIPKTLDFMDALSRGMERRIAKSSIFLKPFVRLETKRLKRYEHFIFNDFGTKTIISEQDQKLIVHANNQQLNIIRNGVDLNFFKPKESEKKYDILFTGNMSYPPNVDGVCYLVEKIMPLVWETNPDLNVAIVGANPSPKVQRLSSKLVNVTGWVDDIRDFYANSRVFIAPMLIGTGLQNKLLEAMAMKMPCITTPLANNALNAEPNKDILIAHTADDFKDVILDLFSSPEKMESLSMHALQFVSENYNWASTTKQLEEVFLNSKPIK